MVSFTQKVYQVVRTIPKGKALTYKEVAERAGSPMAFRAVGTILSKNYDPQIPCHRVIRSDGNLGQYNKRRKKENGNFTEGRIHFLGRSAKEAFPRQIKIIALS